MTTIPTMERPLPSFEQWLAANGTGSHAEGFEAFADLARRTQEQSPAHLTPSERVMLHMWQGLSIAVIELCNIETARGTSPVEVIQIMPRALAAAAMYSTASVLRDDTPWRNIAKVLTEEFRFAAKVCADELTEKAP